MLDFDQLYRERFRQLCAVAARFVGRFEAEDAVHEAMRLAILNQHKFRGGSLYSWVGTITANCAMDILRRRITRERFRGKRSEVVIDDPIEGIVRLEEECWLRKAVAGLPAREREALAAYGRGERDKPGSQVLKNLVHRARARLVSLTIE